MAATKVGTVVDSVVGWVEEQTASSQVVSVEYWIALTEDWTPFASEAAEKIGVGLAATRIVVVAVVACEEARVKSAELSASLVAAGAVAGNEVESGIAAAVVYFGSVVVG